MHVWSQCLSFVLALAGFVIALLPRDYTEASSGEGSFRLIPWPKLTRFPIFWLGLGLLLYILVQALNPAWTYVQRGGSWWMQSIGHIAWLPSGMHTPFVKASPWRSLLIYGSAWLVVCSLWVGFTRRKTLQIFLAVLSVNGFALGLFGVIQRFAGNGAIYWTWLPRDAVPFASFIYKNHAGAYLDLTLAITCALATWFYIRGQRRLEKSNPSALFAFFALFIALTVVLSLSRGAALAMLVFLALLFLGFLLRQIRQPREARRPLIALMLVAFFLLFAGIGSVTLNIDQAWDRMELLLETGNPTVESRFLATQASWDMLKDHWVKGLGAGSFQFYFPVYQQHFPAIFNYSGGRLFFEYAHNDILQIPIELGLFGILVIAACFVYWITRLLRNSAYTNPPALILILGCLMTVGHSWVDFVFYNPAVLITWCALWPVAARWAELEEKTAPR